MTTNDQAPVFDVAELNSVELFSPVVDDTVRFFKDLLGMVETGRDGEWSSCERWRTLSDSR